MTISDRVLPSFRVTLHLIATEAGHHKAPDPDGAMRAHRVALFQSGAIGIKFGGRRPWCGGPLPQRSSDPEVNRLVDLVMSGRTARYRGYCSPPCCAYGERDAAVVVNSGVVLRYRSCAKCSAPLPGSASLRRRFCGVACRVAAHRQSAR